ncbi:threonine synthase [candidate division WOR_3 bacterium SM1_77]|uniref:Threonine synthase n=1 Tax=candidate division WOR_3 bacterium SM1_77 TaxID=1703778 RepID=A0A0S8JT51_UNCW3|nr:MAG: threonine synthase [candidate division WOR_3 bacterium SM1_77]
MNGQYYSTNKKAPKVSLKGALLTGQAPDKGLYMPEAYERIPRDEIISYGDKPYFEIAHAVLKRYTPGMIPDDRLWQLCKECYNYDVPLEKVYDRNHIMRLDQGPTASFKDFAARMMARMMRYFLEQEKSELVILTATSGDTGSAVAHAFHNVDRIHMVVLFPRTEVSDRQRKQMTTLGGNVTVISVEGKFDDCQAMVKRAFADSGLKKIRFSSANSINIGRLLPQTVYYFYAYARLQQKSEPVVFSIPSGNFGDMMGGLIAWRMGLPAARYVIATNANDEFPIFLKTATYQKIVPSRVCISNAMNVGHPSNLARVVDLYGGLMDETGEIRSAPDMEAMRKELFSVSIDDTETRKTIKEAYQKHGVILEPHGAVAWAGLVRYLETGEKPALAISIETAHPAKFPEEITKILGVEPAVPPSLLDLDAKTEHYTSIGKEYKQFKEILIKKFA